MPPLDHSFILKSTHDVSGLSPTMGDRKWTRDMLFLLLLQGHVAEVPMLVWGGAKRSEKMS